jgi:hypothetical protein
MIRIAWCLKEKPEDIYHGSWYPEDDEPVLQSWIESLSQMYPMINHWIESDYEDSE